MDGRAVAVTGAASGLGRHIAVELLTRGRPVILLDRDSDGLDAAVDELGGQGSRATVSAVVADLSTLDGIHAAADELTGRSDLGGLVNNAGGWLPGDQYPDADPDAWLSAITLNLLAPMLLTQRLWARLATGGGAVVTIGSSGGIGDDAYGSPEYAAAKAGIRRFTTSLSARTDVRVMAVVPGWIGLERAHREWAALSPEQQHDVGPLIPPADVAGVVVSLLTDGSPGEVVDLIVTA
ncbi:SDR family oxidoreductase [Mumia sp. zg.B21]|uniref:SDR family NAD(P)-dependent oxidoreductase n=1 Tax=Mumia sp. zg.B21 TaxID=2855447 RepID=UPI001C6F5193|nr:SDR family oxidoreductase [Mumia sp. zg.B21]MBW9208954.1 SDR family oxidoreductase [Mumia sp. zg.B21]